MLDYLGAFLQNRPVIILLTAILFFTVSFPGDTGNSISPELLSAATHVEIVSNDLTTDTDGEMWLRWTAPGDDDLIGRASGYDLRYRISYYGPINNELSWHNAIQVNGEPAPSAAGHPDSMLVTGLTPGESYYFSIKAYDDAGNCSGLSNSPLKTAPGVGLSLDIQISGAGDISIYPEKEFYNFNEVVLLNAIPDSGWYFMRWTGNINTSYNPKLISMNSSYSITANFIEEGDFIAGDANGDGRVQGSDVVFLIQFFRGMGSSPIPYLAGDSNSDCTVTGSDITYLVNYFRRMAPAPHPGDCNEIVLSLKDSPQESPLK